MIDIFTRIGISIIAVLFGVLLISLAYFMQSLDTLLSDVIAVVLVFTALIFAEDIREIIRMCFEKN